MFEADCAFYMGKDESAIGVRVFRMFGENFPGPVKRHEGFDNIRSECCKLNNRRGHVRHEHHVTEKISWCHLIVEDEPGAEIQDNRAQTPHNHLFFNVPATT